MAISGFVGAFAAPAFADTPTTVGTITNWHDRNNNTTAPGAGLLSDDSTTVTVSLQESRTILDWKSTAPLNIASGKTLSFQFQAPSDIVLNRISAGSATINGTLLGKVAGNPGVPGGNIWIAARDGVLFGDGAVVSTGGLLATTSPMTTTDVDFVAGSETVAGSNHIFTFGDALSSASVSIGNAHITVNGGMLAFVAPVVTSAANTGGNGVDGTGAVLYGAANAFKITLAPDSATNWDLVSFEVPAGKGSSASGSIIALAGKTNVTGSVYLAAVNSTLPAKIISVSGSIATSAALDDNGNIVLSAGHDITNNTAASANNGGTVKISLSGSGGLDSAADITLRSQGNIDATEHISAPAGTVTLVSNGAISAGTAAIHAATLTGVSAGATNLSSPGNAIVALNGFVNTSGALSVTDSVPLTVTGTVDATGQSLTLNNTGGGIDASSAAIKAATLTGSSAGTTNLSNSGNIIGTLNSFTDISGPLSISNRLPFTVAGTIDATGQTLTLQSSGGGINAAGAVIHAGTLAESSTGAADFTNSANAIGNLGNFDNIAGPVSIKNTVPMSITGTVDATGQTLTLNNTGGGIAASGIVKAATLTGSSTGTVDFSNAGNLIGTLNNFTNISGPLSIADGTPLTVTGTIDATGQTLSLNNSGGGINAAGAVIHAGTLAGSSAGTADFTNSANAIGNLGSFDNITGPLSIQDTVSMSITGTVNATGQTLTLNDTGGGITASGIVKAGTLTGSSIGTVNFSNAGNLIGTLNNFTNISGPLSIADGTTLTVTGIIDATGQTLALNNSGGGIDASTAIIKADTLTGSSRGNANFTNVNNDIPILGNFSTGPSAVTAGAFAFTDKNPSLSIAGNVAAPGHGATITETVGSIVQSSGTISGGNISLSAVTGSSNISVLGINGTGIVTLKAGGSITQTGGVIAAGELTAGAGTAVSLGTLGTPFNNQIAVLDALRTGTGISLTNTRALDVRGTDVSALGSTGVDGGTGDVTLKTAGAGNSLTFTTAAANVTAGTAAGSQTITLISGSNISQTGGSLTAANLTGSASGSVSLTSSTNDVATFSGFSAGAALSYRDANMLVAASDSSGGALSVTAGGPLSASNINGATNVTLTGSTLDLNGDVTAGAIATLAATAGNVTQNAGTIIAGTISGSASGDAVLMSATNDAGALSGFTVGGTLAYIDANSVTVANGSTGAALSVSAGGAITAGGVTAGTTLSLTGTAIALNGNLTAGPNQTATLTANSGGITQTGGRIKAGTLTGSSTGSTSLSSTTNDIDSLSGFTAGGALAYNDVNALFASGDSATGALSITAAPLTIGGGVTGGPSVTLSGSNLVLNSDVTTAPGGTLTLIGGSGGIAQNAGKITAATLTGASAGTVDLSQPGNAFGSLNNFINPSGALTIRDSVPLTVAGTVDASGHTLTLQNTGGGIAAAGGVIKTANLTGFSKGLADFSNAGNSIANLGGFSNISGALSIRDATPLTISGTVDASGQILTLNNTGGGINASGAIIKALTLTGSSAGAANFSNPGNVIGTLNSFSNSSGPLTVTDSVPLTIAGTVNATGQTLTFHDTGGGIEAAGGALSAKILTGSTQGRANFANAGNSIETLGNFTVNNGDFTLNNSQALDVQGNVRTGALDQTGGPAKGSGNIALKTTAGNLTITGADNSGGKLQGNNVSLTAAGNILIGSGDSGDTPGFISRFRTLDDPAAVDLLIDALMPANSANVFILANSVRVESPGTILQQNTGTKTIPDGIRIFHFGASTAISIFGHPLVVNMFGTLTIDGVPIAASAIASAASVQLFPPTRSNHYRVDNCIIGQGGGCTNIQFTIGAIEALRAAALFTVKASDQGNESDPTITGAGNDELGIQP